MMIPTPPTYPHNANPVSRGTPLSPKTTQPKMRRVVLKAKPTHHNAIASSSACTHPQEQCDAKTTKKLGEAIDDHNPCPKDDPVGTLKASSSRPSAAALLRGLIPADATISITSPNFSENFPVIHKHFDGFNNCWKDGDAAGMHAKVEELYQAFRSAYHLLFAFADAKNVSIFPSVKDEQVNTYRQLDRFLRHQERIRSEDAFNIGELLSSFQKAEALLHPFGQLNTVIFSAILKTKPLPITPAGSEDELEEDSVYHDALEPDARSSVVSWSLHDDGPVPPLHARTDSSTTSGHTKVNSTSSRLSGSTVASTRNYVLPLEIAFASLLCQKPDDDMISLGGQEDAPKRHLGDQLKQAMAMSKLSLLSHKKEVADTAETKPITKRGLHRLRQIAASSSKVSLLSYGKKRSSPLEFGAKEEDTSDVPTARKRHARRKFEDNDLLDPTLQVLVNRRASMASAICFDTQGKVTASTMTGIVTVLSSRDGFQNLALIHSVFSSFRLSPRVTSVDLVMELQNLFVRGPVHLAGTEADHEAETRIYRRRIAKLLVYWFHYHWDDAEDLSALGMFTELVERIVETDSVPLATKEQLRTAIAAVEQSVSPRIPMVSAPKSTTSFTSYAPSPTHSTLFVPPHALQENEDLTAITLKGFNSGKGRQSFAEQLTLLTSDLFGQMQPGLLVQYWSLTADERESFELQHRDDSASVPILAYRDFEEALPLWVTSTILHAHDVLGRVDMIEFWLNVALICLDELHNFSGASCIYAGVGYSAVKQLKKTILTVPGPVKAKYHTLERFFDQHGNFRVAREALAACTRDQPFIPFSALCKKDLHGFRGRAEEVKKSQGSSARNSHLSTLSEDVELDGSGGNYVDVAGGRGKGSVMATLISRQPYTIENDATLQTWLVKRLLNWADNSQRKVYTSMLENIRKEREPRQTRPLVLSDGVPVMTKEGIPQVVEINPYPEYPEVWDYIPTKDGQYVHIGDKTDFVSSVTPSSINRPMSILQSIKTKTKTMANGVARADKKP